jgi:hypothetical protein
MNPFQETAMLLLLVLALLRSQPAAGQTVGGIVCPSDSGGVVPVGSDLSDLQYSTPGKTYQANTVSATPTSRSPLMQQPATSALAVVPQRCSWARSGLLQTVQSWPSKR